MHYSHQDHASSHMKVAKQFDQGATLILSIVVLSAVLVISLSLSTLSVREQRTAGEIRRSEPALYVSEGALEELVFMYVRGDSLSTVQNCQNVSTTGTFADPSTSVAYHRCINFRTPVLNFTLAPGEVKFLLISDRSNPDRFPSGHRWVGACLKTGSTLQFDIFSFENTTVNTAAESPDSNLTGNFPICPSTVTANDVNYATAPLDPSGFYFMRLKNTGTNSIAGSIVAKDADNVQIDLPSETALLQSLGINVSTQRRVQVEVPQ